MLPALLKARYGLNEIITTLMMSFLGTSLANVLIKLVLRDPDTTVPQTRQPAASTTGCRACSARPIHAGSCSPSSRSSACTCMMTRTAFGLRLQVLGANRAAAVHAGLRVERLTFAAFALSAALIGLAGAVEVLGVWGTVAPTGTRR